MDTIQQEIFSPNSLEALRQGIEELLLAREVQTQTIRRCAQIIFRDELKAVHGIARSIRRSGIDATMTIIAGKDRVLGFHYFGTRRGGWLASRAERERIAEAIRELPEALRTRERISGKLADLQQTYVRLLERSGERGAPEQGNVRGRTRER